MWNVTKHAVQGKKNKIKKVLSQETSRLAVTEGVLPHCLVKAWETWDKTSKCFILFAVWFVVSAESSGASRVCGGQRQAEVAGAASRCEAREAVFCAQESDGGHCLESC